jgi:hypothetical protein
MIAVGTILDRVGAVARSRAVPDRNPSGFSPGWRVATTYSYERSPRRSGVSTGLERCTVATNRDKMRHRL